MAKPKPSQIDRHVSQRLRELRGIHNVTQQDLARKVGVSFQQIQKYESGENRMSAGRLYEIAEAMHIHVHDFYAGLSSNNPM